MTGDPNLFLSLGRTDDMMSYTNARRPAGRRAGIVGVQRTFTRDSESWLNPDRKTQLPDRKTPNVVTILHVHIARSLEYSFQCIAWTGSTLDWCP